MTSNVIYVKVQIMVYKLCDSNWNSQIVKATWRRTIQGDHISGKYIDLFIIMMLLRITHEILTHIIIDLQTVHLNILSSTYIKMKIFLALVLSIYFNWSVVLGSGK